MNTRRQNYYPTLTSVAPIESLPILNHIQTVSIPRTSKPTVNYTDRDIKKEKLMKIKTPKS